MNEFWADVIIELFPPSEGGRTQPLNLSNDNPGQYRPHLRVIGGSGDLLGVAFMDGPDNPVGPGNPCHATIKALYHPDVSYQELVDGAAFEILEGSKIVGIGSVTRRN